MVEQKKVKSVGTILNGVKVFKNTKLWIWIWLWLWVWSKGGVDVYSL